MAPSSIIGQSVPRLDSPSKATGKCIYTGDMKLPNMLHGRILRSAVPHARIAHLDTTRAARLPGVKAIVTGKDTSGVKYGFMERFQDRLALAIDRVRYVGDEIAAVAAVDRETAEEALELMELELEELPAVFDPLEAMKPGAPNIHDHVANNIGHKVVIERGEVEEGFRTAYHIREDTFSTQSQCHAPMEPHVCIAWWDPAAGLTVWSSTQTPYFAQEDLAKTLQLPRSRVRVIKPPTGGGFGAKSEGMDSLEFAASLLSMKIGHPVQIVYDREEEFLATRRRHPAILHLKTAVDRDGMILAKDCRVILDGGAYYSTGVVATFILGGHFFLPYAQKGLRYEGIRVYTNRPPGGAMRGYTSPQAHFAQDVQMDLIARDLGMDPLELRRRNALKVGETALNGYRILSSSFTEGLAEFGKNRPASNQPARGQGVGCAGFGSGAAHRVRPGNEAYSAARIVAREDGFFTIYSGTSDVGQGSDTILCQLVAQDLGVPLEKVQIVTADTTLTPPDLGTYSSRVTTMAGNAVLMAAREVARQLRDAAAQKIEANPADLDLAEERIYVRGSPERGLPMAEAVVLCQLSQGGAPVAAQGTFNTKARGAPTFSFSSQMADLTVDRETGQVHVAQVSCAHDCGVAINPMSVEGQLEGSVHMGMGFALSEEAAFEGGVFLNPSFLDYKVATALEMPRVELHFAEAPDPIGPYGAKEAGEGAVGPTAPAIINAIKDATGCRLTSLPASPEAVLRAIETSGGQEG